MKIAVVGKWWSGKTTISALLIAHLLYIQKSVVAIDADTNMHLGSHFDIRYLQEKALSSNENTSSIKTALIGNNQRIESPAHMVKTTPPGRESLILNHAQDPFFQRYATGFVENAPLLFVGWYTAEGTGISCYHTSLSILENILSHTQFEDDICIVDMVASTDAFSNTLHAQFDALYLVVEPTKESVLLAQEYKRLAQAAGTEKYLYLLWNKVMDDDDNLFLTKSFPEFLTIIPYDRWLKKSLQHWTSLLEYYRTSAWVRGPLLNPLLQMPKHSRREALLRLATLHKKYSQLDYIKGPLGDLSSQIDEDYILAHH